MSVFNCGKHDHNTQEGAARCRHRRAGKRADRALERSGALTHRSLSELQVYDTPKIVQRGFVSLYVFAESPGMPYENTRG